MKTLKSSILILLLLSGVFFGGCRISRSGAAESGQYYVNPYADFSGIGRVVVFEFENHSNSPELSRTLTEMMVESLQKRHLFGVSALLSSDPAWRSLELDDSSGYSLEKLSIIRKQLNADAILYGSITQYYPYPHMLTGLCLKLLDLREGKLLWATEQVWDSTDKSVELRMKRYFEGQMRSGYEPMDWHLLVTSPRAFNKFVAYEVAQTLPSSGGQVRIRVSSEKNRGLRGKK